MGNIMVNMPDRTNYKYSPECKQLSSIEQISTELACTQQFIELPQEIAAEDRKNLKQQEIDWA